MGLQNHRSLGQQKKKRQIHHSIISRSNTCKTISAATAILLTISAMRSVYAFSTRVIAQSPLSRASRSSSSSIKRDGSFFCNRNNFFNLQTTNTAVQSAFSTSTSVSASSSYDVIVIGGGHAGTEAATGECDIIIVFLVEICEVSSQVSHFFQHPLVLVPGLSSLHRTNPLWVNYLAIHPLGELGKVIW